MSELLKTKNYDMFKKHDSNRPIDERNLKNIMFSIECKNMLDMRPVIVDSQMRIIDGQHRIEAAKRLGLEVYYQIKKDCDNKDMILLNSNQQRWTLEDYMNFYASEGIESYIELKQFITHNNYDFPMVFRLISDHGGRFMKSFKAGKLKHIDKERFDYINTFNDRLSLVIDMISTYVLDDCNFVKLSTFKKSLMVFLEKDIDIEIFLQKVKVKAHAIKRCATSVEYQMMWTGIYNWKNQNPI